MILGRAATCIKERDYLAPSEVYCLPGRFVASSSV